MCFHAGGIMISSDPKDKGWVNMADQIKEPLRLGRLEAGHLRRWARITLRGR